MMAAVCGSIVGVEIFNHDGNSDSLADGESSDSDVTDIEVAKMEKKLEAMKLED